eukprot:CAMPEP_0197313680 /NCGR_PEP_ID=MMETSP0891-20130614/29281_1 /TAXON_ID=44058 ORGANISM="Aureoumbra lagunensis, Strain CCMP1510" /NCGR_SAMPLE_ID=MMETSP0891 /ASSEMBLY_ACC=CAM_ASM_000534 /LENGTH=655 /DNA_ID=CAMNT_0042801685 /DNA_START=9 /DNA_END=1973 /DNA_ORIENTATION=+
MTKDDEHKKKRKKSGDEEEEAKQIKKRKKEEKRKKKKRDDDEDEVKSEAEDKVSPLLVETAIPAHTQKRPRTRSMDLANEREAALATAPKGSAALNDFPLSQPTLAALAKKGVRVLFPIQVATWRAIYEERRDVLGRAKTGTGKTLAFALPMIELLIKNPKQAYRGSPPRALILAPTRELAMQVFNDCEIVAAGRLTCVCVYGGSPYGPQCDSLRRGVDIVVGTPGRTKDLLDKQVLSLNMLDFAILDEADEMLSMGFKDELDYIFEAMGTNEQRQLLLFSATVPSWVRSTADNFARNQLIEIDLVKQQGDTDTSKASTDVRHICIPAHWQQVHNVINEVRAAYAGEDARCVLFCETKIECNEIIESSALRYERRALHGDVAQKDREKTINAFKQGKFKLLVATDVAARGLDMIVDLVIMNKPPTSRSGRADTETYVHRSGRTGRAGRKGICVTLYGPRQRAALEEIERATNNHFEWRGAPRAADVLQRRADDAISAISHVDDSAIQLFAPHADQLISSFQDDTKRALAATLAKLAGFDTAPPSRSLLSNSEGYVTCKFDNPNAEINSLSYVWTALRRSVDPNICEQIRGMTLAADRLSAVFDVPEAQLSAFSTLPNVDTDIAELPAKLLTKTPTASPGSSRGRGGGHRGGGRGW